MECFPKWVWYEHLARKGKENRVEDALSRKLHCVYELYYNQLESKFLDQVKEEAQKEPEYQFLWQQMEEIRK